MFFLRTFFLISCLLFGCFLSVPVHAVEYGGLGGKPVHRNPADARTESWFILTAAPGATLEDELLVVNNTSETKEVEIYPADTAKASGGGFALKQKLDQMKEIGSWTKISKTRLTLGPHAQEVVPFQLMVPSSVTPGEYAGALIVQEVAAPMMMDGGIALSLRMGVRIYLTVPGTMKRSLGFEGIQVRSNPDGSRYASLSLASQGNASVDVKDGAIEVIELPSQRIVSRAPLTGFQVLRDAPLVQSVTWMPGWQGGNYQVRAWVTYLDGKGVLQRAEFSSEAMPIAMRLPGVLPIGVGLGLAGLFGCTTYMVQRRKKHVLKEAPVLIAPRAKKANGKPKSYARTKKRTKT